jgi:hypothetical protein
MMLAVVAVVVLAACSGRSTPDATPHGAPDDREHHDHRATYHDSGTDDDPAGPSLRRRRDRHR